MYLPAVRLQYFFKKRTEAALPPSAPDRPVSDVRRIISSHGGVIVIKKTALLTLLSNRAVSR